MVRFFKRGATLPQGYGCGLYLQPALKSDTVPTGLRQAPLSVSYIISRSYCPSWPPPAAAVRTAGPKLMARLLVLLR